MWFDVNIKQFLNNYDERNIHKLKFMRKAEFNENRILISTLIPKKY